MSFHLVLHLGPKRTPAKEANTLKCEQWNKGVHINKEHNQIEEKTFNFDHAFCPSPIPPPKRS